MLTKILVGIGALLAAVPVLFVAAGMVMFTLGGDEWPPVRENSAAAADLPPGALALADADPGALADAVLSNPRIGLRPAARRDVERGAVDPRVLVVLLVVAERHELSWVGPFATGHSFFVHGTHRPSNHAFGRAVDVPMVDGSAVTARNEGARDAVRLVAALPPSMRPDETGCPWADLEALPGVFSDQSHDDHLHFGFDG